MTIISIIIGKSETETNRTGSFPNDQDILYVHMCMYVYIYIYTHVYIYIYIYIIPVCIYTYIYIYISGMAPAWMVAVSTTTSATTQGTLVRAAPNVRLQ